MQVDKQFRVAGRWALASDGVQWVIQRQNGKRWEAVKFIHSTKAHLASRMRGMMPPEDAERLLEGLPDTFDEWFEARPAVYGHGRHDAANRRGVRRSAEDRAMP
jgi:hypothetical protein